MMGDNGTTYAFDVKILSMYEPAPMPRYNSAENTFFNESRIVLRLVPCHVEGPKLETTKTIAIIKNVVVIACMAYKKILGIVQSSIVIFFKSALFPWLSHASILRWYSV